MKRLIDSALYLAKQELPFRGHEESESSLNRGNYVKLLNLLREYDPPRLHLDKQLESSALSKGTSPHAQNDIDKAFSQVIIKYIKKKYRTPHLPPGVPKPGGGWGIYPPQ